MSDLERNLRSYLHPDGIRIVMLLDNYRQLRHVSYLNLTLSKIEDWGAIIIDDMKQQLHQRARTKP